MTNFEENILKRVKENNLKEFTVVQLCKKFEFKKGFEQMEVAKALKSLASEGQLVSISNDKYKLLDTTILIKGVIKGNRKGFAFLMREDKEADLFIPNKSLNGAKHKDTVYCSIVDGDEAKVESIIERGPKIIVGTFSKAGKVGFVIPDDDCYFNDIFVGNQQIANNSKVIVEIDVFDDGKNPTGKVIEVLGKRGSINAEVLSILKKYGFEESFDKKVLDATDSIQEPTRTKRTDFTSLQTITIDGDDAKDFDDAISLEMNNDNYMLYVHIADVTAYVKLNGVLDMEARKRGTSVYFPSNVFPMLPEKISNNLCSLRPKEDRLVLTAIMEITPLGKVVNLDIKEGIINSDERMTYKKVTAILEGDKELVKEYSHIVDLLKRMQSLARILNGIRKARGSINFQSKECYIVLDDEGNPIGLEKYPLSESNSIIEEFMLLANESVAEYAFHTGYPFVYRVHEEPLYEKQEELKLFLKGVGINVREKTLYPTQYVKILESVQGTPVENIVNKVLLRSMCKAKYDTANLKHFGLAARFYCHFTSPIRRYPDLTIHRILKDIINGQMNDKNIAKYVALTESVAVSSSERERASELAERDIDDFYKTLYMANHIGDTFMGVISGVTRFGIFVELDNTVEGMIRIEDLPGYGYNYDEKKYLLTNKLNTYKLGEELAIKVDDADIYSGRIKFVLDKTIIKEKVEK